MNNLMVDLETMGNKPDAPIVAIGAVFFEPATSEIGPSFYTAVSLESEVALGAVPDASTILWWLAQSSEARSAITDNPTPIDVALRGLNDFSAEVSGNSRRIYVWAMVLHSITLFFVRPMSAASYNHAGAGLTIWT
jgi:3' exoribonuclease, RNase T-like